MFLREWSSRDYGREGFTLYLLFGFQDFLFKVGRYHLPSGEDSQDKISHFFFFLLFELIALNAELGSAFNLEKKLYFVP